MFRNMCLVGAVLLAGSALLAQDTKTDSSYQLSYKFKEGEKWLEVVTLHQLSSSDDESMGAMIKMDSDREITYLNEVRSVSRNGTAKIDVTVKRIKLKTSQAGMNIIDYDSDKDKGKEVSKIPMVQEMVKGIDQTIDKKFAVKIDNTGKTLETKGEDGTNTELVQTPRVVFPPNPLKQGDTWTYEASLSAVNPIMSQVKINCVLDSMDGSTVITKSEIAVTGKSSDEMKDFKFQSGTATLSFDTKIGKLTKANFHIEYQNTLSNAMFPKDITLNNKVGLSVETMPAGASEEKKEDKKDKAEF